MNMTKILQNEHLYKILLAPHVSEKATNLETLRKYVFKVANFATKETVKEAVEKLFNVHVTSVRILNTKSKAKRVGKIEGRRKAWKKAYVMLKDGEKLDLGTNVA